MKIHLSQCFSYSIKSSPHLTFVKISPFPTSKPECCKTKFPFFFLKGSHGQRCFTGDDSQQTRSSKGAPTRAWVSSARAQGIPAIDLPGSNRGFLPSIFFLTCWLTTHMLLSNHIRAASDRPYVALAANDHVCSAPFGHRRWW